MISNFAQNQVSKTYFEIQWGKILDVGQEEERKNERKKERESERQRDRERESLAIHPNKNSQ